MNPGGMRRICTLDRTDSLEESARGEGMRALDGPGWGVCAMDGTSWGEGDRGLARGEGERGLARSKSDREPARGDRGESARGEGVRTDDLDCGERDLDLDVPDSRNCCRVKTILGKNYLKNKFKKSSERLRNG